MNAKVWVALSEKAPVSSEMLRVYNFFLMDSSLSFGHPAKRRRALLESIPPRDSRRCERMAGSCLREDSLLFCASFFCSLCLKKLKPVLPCTCRVLSSLRSCRMLHPSSTSLKRLQKRRDLSCLDDGRQLQLTLFNAAIECGLIPDHGLLRPLHGPPRVHASDLPAFSTAGCSPFMLCAMCYATFLLLTVLRSR